MAHPLALQLRNLQSLVEIGVAKNTTAVFSLPLMSTIGALGAFFARQANAATVLAAVSVAPPGHRIRDRADLTRPRRKGNQTMSLAIDVTRVTHVLLADAWHEVADGSFTVAPYEFGQPSDAGAGDRHFAVLYNSGNVGTDPVGFEFTEARTSALMSGPLRSVIAVRREHP